LTRGLLSAIAHGNGEKNRRKRRGREANNRKMGIDVARRPDPNSQIDAVQIGIGAALRSVFAAILREPLPEEMAKLLRQLDDAPEGSHRD
jgi:hypothetical protein